MIHWLHVILPSLFGPAPDKMSSSTSLYLSTKMAATLPGPAWAHLVKSCLSYDFLLPTNIMTQVSVSISLQKQLLLKYLINDDLYNRTYL